MTAYFDQNQDLWIEVDVTQNLPPNVLQTTGVQYVTHPQQNIYQQTTMKAVTYMNLTKYISELRLTKIIQEVTKDN